MNNFLTCFDIDFRNSLYKHNQYHISNRGLDPKFSLRKSSFSFRNIHQNIGGVRWYSTSKGSSSKSSSTKSKSFSDSSSVYQYLYRWLSESPINDDTQKAMENYLLNYTYIGLENKDNKDNNPLIDYSLYSKNLVELLIHKKSQLNSILDNFRKVFNDNNNSTKRVNQKETSRYFLNVLLKEVNNNEVISIMLGRLMRIITRHNRLYSNEGVIDIFHDLCDNIIRDYWFSLYSKDLDKLCLEELMSKDKDSLNKLRLSKMKIYTLSDWKRKNINLVNIFDNVTLKSNIGGIIIDWMIECNLIQIKVVIASKNKKASVLVPSKEVLSSLGANLNKGVNLPFRIPMIVKPKPYFREKIKGVIVERLGGYLLNDVQTADKLILDNWELKESTILKDANVVYALVNNMQSIGYKINKDLLKFIDEYGIKYDLIIYNDHPLSDKPYKILKKFEKLDLESHLNKVELQENILGLARVFSLVHEFFLPVRIDFRGRMYCVSEYLNYQSTELAKSLLLFSKGEKIKKSDIKAINYFKAFGANCYGNKLDKKSWNDRVK
jgi:DNA-directed RNA polymerase